VARFVEQSCAAPAAEQPVWPRQKTSAERSLITPKRLEQTNLVRWAVVAQDAAERLSARRPRELMQLEPSRPVAAQLKAPELKSPEAELRKLAEPREPASRQAAQPWLGDSPRLEAPLPVFLLERAPLAQSRRAVVQDAK
jgi:hypothetical protein